MRLAILKYVGWERGLLLDQLKLINENIWKEYKKLPVARKQPLKVLSVDLTREGMKKGFLLVRDFHPDVILHAFGGDLSYPNCTDEVIIGSSEFLLEEDNTNELMISGTGWLAPDIRIKVPSSEEFPENKWYSISALLASCSEENALKQLSMRIRNTSNRIGCVMIDDIPIGNSISLRVARRILRLSIPIMVNIIPSLAKKEVLRSWLALKEKTPHLVGFGQHGYSHYDHSEMGRPYEFGPSRGFQEQLNDIITGKNILEQLLGESIQVFCAPFAFYDTNTLYALEQAGFTDLIGAENRLLWNGTLCQWNGTCNPINSGLSNIGWKRILLGRLVLTGRSERHGNIGIVFHPNAMSSESISWTIKILQTLKRNCAVSWQILNGVRNHKC
jgi:hypothetical protein